MSSDVQLQWGANSRHLGVHGPRPVLGHTVLGCELLFMAPTCEEGVQWILPMASVTLG